jgi:uncharacterized protein YoxC
MKHYLVDTAFIVAIVFVIISGRELNKALETHSDRLDKLEASNIELVKQSLYEHDLLTAFLSLLQDKK